MLAIVRGVAAVLAVLAIAVFVDRPGQEQAARTLVREPVPLPVPIATEPALRRDQVSPARGRPALPPPDIIYTYSVSSAGPVTSDVEEFAAHAAVTLNDPRGWALDGAIAFRRVPEGGDFTLWLATPEEVAAWADTCSAEYSCRVGRDVIINDARWAEGAQAWSGPLDAYRRYVVNHEVGHWLGFGHADCPAPDRPAPVMHQQSKGLDGCQPQVWPDDAERGAVRERLPSARSPR